MTQRLVLCLGLVSFAASADYMDHFAQRNDVGVHKAPYLGEMNVLLIPVEGPGYPPLDEAALREFFSADAPGGFGRYYRAASLGRYRPTVTVAPKVVLSECPLPIDQFPKCRLARGDVNGFTYGMGFIHDSVKAAHDAGMNFADFDRGGRLGTPDGWADGVMILTNLPFGGIAFPFAFFNRGDNLAGGTNGPLIVDGIKVGHVAIAGYSNQHVMVHEFGHLLGLTDLYDQGFRWDGLHLSVMGSWGYDPLIPLPDAETRFRLLWGNWHQVSGKQRVVVKPAETSGEVWRLGEGDEYFLVENRGPGGEFDRAFTHRGLAVFHVDRRVKLLPEEGRFVERLFDCPNGDPWHPYISLLQADARFDLEQGPGVEVNYNTDLFAVHSTLKPESSGLPVSAQHQVLSSNDYLGHETGVRISEIALRDDQSIEVTFEAPVAGCVESLCEGSDGCVPVTCGEVPPSCGCTAGAGLLPLLAVVWLFRQRLVKPYATVTESEL